MSEFTYRNQVQRDLEYDEVDANFARVEELHDEALEARDISVAATIIYPDTTAGLAATAEGGYFVVPDVGTDELIFYHKETGVAVEKVRIGYRVPFVGGTLTGALNHAPPVSLASAATVAIGAAAANAITITGTVTITAFDTIAAGAIRVLTFAAALTLTHNATSLILPGGANIVTAANDVAVMHSLGGGNWQCVLYQRANGYQPLDATLTSIAALGTAADKIAYTTGVDTWAETTITAAGRALIDDASAAAQLTTLGTTAFNTFESADQTITVGGSLQLTHGLGSTPRMCRVGIVCQTAELNYSVGDFFVGDLGNPPAIVANGTSLDVRFASSAIQIPNKTTGAFTAITAANWKARFIAIK